MRPGTRIRTIALGGLISGGDQALIAEVAGALRPDDPALDEWCRGYARGQAPRLAQDLGIVGSHVAPGAAILEVGCSPPILTLALRRRGYAVTAVDLDPSRFGSALAGAGIRALRCDIERDRIPVPEASFDYVLFHEVFEHLRIHIPRTLGELRRVLRPGGRLFISTPNLLYVNGLARLPRTGRLGPSIAAEYGKLDTVGHMGHVRLYTPGEVADACAAAGLEPEALIYRSPHPRPAARRVSGRLWRLGAPLVMRALPALSQMFELICRRTDG